jgi:hypothetical protein
MPMQKTELRVAFAALCLALSTVNALASPPLRTCAARDRQILMLIEESESTNGLEPATSSEIMATMTTARMTCYEGHPQDALALYDAIAEKVAAAAFAVQTSPTWFRRRPIGDF